MEIGMEIKSKKLILDTDEQHWIRFLLGKIDNGASNEEIEYNKALAEFGSRASENFVPADMNYYFYAYPYNIGLLGIYLVDPASKWVLLCDEVLKAVNALILSKTGYFVITLNDICQVVKTEPNDVERAMRILWDTRIYVGEYDSDKYGISNYKLGSDRTNWQSARKYSTIYQVIDEVGKTVISNLKKKKAKNREAGTKKLKEKLFEAGKIAGAISALLALAALIFAYGKVLFKKEYAKVNLSIVGIKDHEISVLVENTGNKSAAINYLDYQFDDQKAEFQIRSVDQIDAIQVGPGKSEKIVGVNEGPYLKRFVPGSNDICQLKFAYTFSNQSVSDSIKYPCR
jgi:hypothetical protein